jgi:hypothetical protein
MEYISFDEEEEDYAPRRLLKPGPLENPDALGLPVHFLNAMYLDVVPPRALHHRRSWKQWLTEFAGVQSYPQLLKPTNSTLSVEFMYIIEHRPEILVRLLKRFWSSYESDMGPIVVRKLKNCLVPSNAGVVVNLASTFLPLPRLKTIVDRLKIASFPFLVMPRS